MFLSTSYQPEPAVVASLGPDHLAITAHFGAEDAAAVGVDAELMAESLLTALRTLSALRTGHVSRQTAAGGVERRPTDPDTWHWTMVDLEFLAQRIEGIRRAVIRAYPGSHADLALAMDVPRATAQTRRRAVQESAPTVWEDWARGEIGK